MKKLIVANWKMHPESEREAVTLAKEQDFQNVVVLVPFPFLLSVKSVFKKAYLGAQNICAEESGVGAYTGEVSAVQLRKLGVRYILVGHSERRMYLRESDEDIRRKILMAHKAGLEVILCVGENLSIRRTGMTRAKTFVSSQLAKDLEGIASQSLKKIMLAYEPIWAISSQSGGESDTPRDAEEMVSFIKECLSERKRNMRVLYGGSVNKRNIREFLAMPSIDGVLVGGASVRKGELKAMRTGV